MQLFEGKPLCDIEKDVVKDLSIISEMYDRNHQRILDYAHIESKRTRLANLRLAEDLLNRLSNEYKRFLGILARDPGPDKEKKNDGRTEKEKSE